MATALDIITRGMRMLGVIGSGQTPTAEEIADGLTILNAMLDSWSNERLTVHVLKQDNHTTTGATSYSIGSGGTINSVRPIRIESAFLRENNVDTALEIISRREDYDSITNKSRTGTGAYLYYDPVYPLGLIYVWPIPNGPVLHISSWKPFSTFTALTDPVSLPPGYERAISANFAIDYASEFGVQVRGDVAEIAREAKANIKRANVTSSLMAFDSGLSSYGTFDIYSGYYQ